MESNIYKDITSFIKIKALYSVVKYKIPDILGDYNGLTINEISEKANVNCNNLERILTYLIKVGIFKKINDKYINNDNSKIFIYNIKNSLAPAILHYGDEVYNSFSKFETILENNNDKNPFQLIYNNSIWNWYNLPQNNNKLNNLNKYLEQHLIIIDYDWKKYYGMKILDIGGNNGNYFKEIMNEYPRLNVTVFDNLNNIENTKNIKYIKGNFLSEIPDNYDVYFLRWILHNWDDNNSSTILKNIRKVMHENSVLLISEQVYSEDIFTLTLDLKMKCLLDGKVRTKEEFVTLLKRTGFDIKNIIKNNNNHIIIEAIPIINDIYPTNVKEDSERLISQHFIIKKYLNGNIHVPVDIIENDNINILDVGCGTGIWCLDLMKDIEKEYGKKVKIYGTDIYKRYSKKNIENITFDYMSTLDEIKNVSLKFIKYNNFDFIHQRLMFCAFKLKDWEKAVENIKKLLKNKGWIEIVETDSIIRCNNKKLTDNIKIIETRWQNYLKTCNIDIKLINELQDILNTKGFINVEKKKIKIPMYDYANNWCTAILNSKNKLKHKDETDEKFKYLIDKCKNDLIKDDYYIYYYIYTGQNII